MRKIVTFVAILLVCFATLLFALGLSIKLNPEEYKIAGISIEGTNESEINRFLGTPISIGEGLDPILRLRKYQNIQVESWENGLGTLNAIYVTGREYKTYRGIRVGDPVKRVYEKYRVSKDKEGHLTFCLTDLGNLFRPIDFYSIQFNIANGKVAKIIYNHQLD